jgi:hypothetical protein
MSNGGNDNRMLDDSSANDNRTNIR